MKRKNKFTPGDRVMVMVPRKWIATYPRLHKANGTVEVTNSTTGRVHVALNIGGLAIVEPKWLRSQ